jgi:hypothetical protein
MLVHRTPKAIAAALSGIALLSVCYSRVGAESGGSAATITVIGGQHGSQVNPRCKPDLIVPFVTPSPLTTKGGRIVYVYDQTLNFGGPSSVASVTRYYVSTQYPVAPADATILGARSIGPLEPNEQSSAAQQMFAMPERLPYGDYYVTACADADNQIDEANEDNNCTTGKWGIRHLSIPEVSQKCIEKRPARVDLSMFLFDPFEPGIDRLIGKADANEKILRRFGKPLRVETRLERDRLGPGVAAEVKIWSYEGLQIVTEGAAGGGQHWIRQVTLTSSKPSLKFDLTIGSPREQFVAALGSPRIDSWYTRTTPIGYAAVYRGTESFGEQKQIDVYTTSRVKIFFDKNARANKIVWDYADEHWRYRTNGHKRN